MKRSLLTLVSALVVVATAYVALPAGGSSPTRAPGVHPDQTLAREGGRSGRAPVSERLSHLDTPGWIGEHPVHRSANDWEPTIAADPNEPWVYVLTTRYGEPVCEGCPDPYLALAISSDGGRSFAEAGPLCACHGIFGQYDPQIAVAEDGSLAAVWINGEDVVFSRSTDHGASWSAPLVVAPGTGWADKPWLVASPDGIDLYISFHGEDNLFVASHDAGVTWAAPVPNYSTGETLFSSGGTVTPSGAVVFAGTVLGHDASGRLDLSGGTRIVMLRSTDDGATWSSELLGISRVPEECESALECEPARLDAQASVASDSAGNLMVAYGRYADRWHPAPMFVRMSRNYGATWSPKVRLSPRRSDGRPVITAGATVTADDRGDFRLIWSDDRTGLWNTYFSQMRDSGGWSEALRISDALGGATYKAREGFHANYGDYAGIDVTSTGSTVAVWGEGRHEVGPGGSWTNLGR